MRKITWIFIAIALGVWYFNSKDVKKTVTPVTPPATQQPSKN
ncbi:hypothetical protein SJI19_14290 [Acerihabitans sp. TG2]|nr:hypothetical protein [Acerihabitans sp. TG2]MEA9391697.1 hypothetical protein [Acerihabitans sp. TG2]